MALRHAREALAAALGLLVMVVFLCASARGEPRGEEAPEEAQIFVYLWRC